MSIILGIDPGSRTTGYGLVEARRGQPYYLASGCIRLDQHGDLAARLECLFASLQSIVSDYQPSQAAIEQVFVGKSAGSALKLGQARGVALLVPA
ncbi:MAG: crossover junction endodeoxyribonuclease RuvC, partial [Pseudomonadales bacterium]|nr:crossover junction endodeoxyribonuclease RuvC [Pseudomonadales bacterium]